LFLVDLLRSGRDQVSDPASVPALTDLVQLMLMPYLGRREAAKPAG
jgi:hypothetical protein